MSGSKSSVPAANDSPEGLTLTVHSLPDPQAMAAQQRTRAGRLRMMLVMAACAAPVIASYFMFYVVQPRGQAYGELIVPTVQMPATLSLRDMDGAAVDPASLQGQWLLTAVQGGACDSDCERLLFMQRQLREMLGKERDKVDKLLLLADEQALKPELLAALTEGIAVTILRAPRAELEAWLKPAAGQRLEDHLFLIDPMGRWMMREPAHPDPAKVKNDLNRLLKAAAGWDQAGR